MTIAHIFSILLLFIKLFISDVDYRLFHPSERFRDSQKTFLAKAPETWCYWGWCINCNIFGSNQAGDLYCIYSPSFSAISLFMLYNTGMKCSKKQLKKSCWLLTASAVWFVFLYFKLKNSLQRILHLNMGSHLFSFMQYGSIIIDLLSWLMKNQKSSCICICYQPVIEGHSWSTQQLIFLLLTLVLYISFCFEFV